MGNAIYVDGNRPPGRLTGFFANQNLVNSAESTTFCFFTRIHWRHRADRFLVNAMVGAPIETTHKSRTESYHVQRAR